MALSVEIKYEKEFSSYDVKFTIVWTSAVKSDTGIETSGSVTMEYEVIDENLKEWLTLCPCIAKGIDYVATFNSCNGELSIGLSKQKVDFVLSDYGGFSSGAMKISLDVDSCKDAFAKILDRITKVEQ
jgi:hypothetical protein